MVMVCMSPVNPMSEFRVMMIKEDPTAFFMGRLAHSTSAGIYKKSPLAPITPVMVPMAIP